MGVFVLTHDDKNYNATNNRNIKVQISDSMNIFGLAKNNKISSLKKVGVKYQIKKAEKQIVLDINEVLLWNDILNDYEKNSDYLRKSLEFKEQYNKIRANWAECFYSPKDIKNIINRNKLEYKELLDEIKDNKSMLKAIKIKLNRLEKRFINDTKSLEMMYKRLGNIDGARYNISIIDTKI